MARLMIKLTKERRLENKKREARGRAIVDRYSRAVNGEGWAYEPVDQNITDLVADLLHYAHGVGFDDDAIDGILRMARAHCDAERNGEY